MRLILPVILTAVLSIMVMLCGCADPNGSDQRLLQAVAVSIQEVRPFSSEMEIAYSGTIEEALSVPLSFSVLGTVYEVRVNEGDRVHKGQLLAALNPESWQNSYDIAVAKQTQAEDAYQRMQPMHESGSLPAIKWVEVETGLQQAKSTAALAKKNLDDCKLYATIDGIVGRRSIEPGMSVTPAISSITLVGIDTVYAKISISEGEIAAVKKDMSAGVIVSALGHARYRGVVEQVGVMADPLMHTYKAKIAIPNQDHTLLPGMLCNVTVVDSSNQTGVIVPTGCVMADENGNHYLFVADTTRNIAQRREVTPGTFVKTGLEITSGLQFGEWIIVSGQQKLSDQSPISYRRQSY
jgi:membrane fusion protein, multidrug efflux system